MTTRVARSIALHRPDARTERLRNALLHVIVPAAIVATAIAASSSAHAELPKLPPLPPLPSLPGLPDIKINPPGVYGRVVLGNLPQPPLVFPQPVIVRPAPVAVQTQPVYLYVPPGHAKHWSHHCHRYQACNQPVYFVREEWVRERHAVRGHHHGHGRKPPPVYRGHAGDDDHDHDHGHGRGKGRGHGKDKG